MIYLPKPKPCESEREGEFPFGSSTARWGTGCLLSVSFSGMAAHHEKSFILFGRVRTWPSNESLFSLLQAVQCTSILDSRSPSLGLGDTLLLLAKRETRRVVFYREFFFRVMFPSPDVCVLFTGSGRRFIFCVYHGTLRGVRERERGVLLLSNRTKSKHSGERVASDVLCVLCVARCSCNLPGCIYVSLHIGYVGAGGGYLGSERRQGWVSSCLPVLFGPPYEEGCISSFT